MARKKSKELTERHKKVLKFLVEFQSKEGYPPTIREIGEAADISSTSVVNYYLDRLETLGYIERERGVIRGIKVVKALYESPSKLPEDLKLSIAPKVFISYAREDVEYAKGIFSFLSENNLAPWLDVVNLLPGQDWEFEIQKSIRASDYIIICLSNNSVTKRGYVQKEIRMALSVLDEIPEGEIFLIPIRFEKCDVPSALMSKHWLDWFAPDSKEKLLRVFDYPNISERFSGKTKSTSFDEPEDYVLDSLKKDKSIDEIITHIIFEFDMPPSQAEQLFNQCYKKWLYNQ